ncbi:putative sulfate transporter [Caenibius tardaugens NBRC 16725]|uniref:Putative sulfate transporter n=1 Tax=Caenibius tardaugens NBRC 16725 TaxID=1219035 RepID=U2YAP6_9SPHN|nr:SulP family inorganic anion transporter [Caenibius tardaugens]AZI35407.1 SulP family inorganic anion transporter [Caenibius tardaugens NBRC 16725]GAD50501.1 putative sulfate transporter [Caenibius tardaugens NBRC 16725]
MKRGDLIAGLSVAGLMLPEAVAYSAIAGLPAQHAIFTAIAGAAMYAFVGGSRFAIVSPTSSSATILAAMIGMTAADDATKAMFAAITTFFVGLIFVIAGLLRLGGLTSFVSRPVLRGFALGLAVTIIIKQLPIIAGIDLGHGTIWHILTGLAVQLPHWNWASVIIGFLALAALLMLRRIPAVPGTICVLVTGIAASLVLDLPARGVATVGMISLSVQWPDLSGITPRDAETLLELTLPLLLVLLAESWGTMRTLALQHNDTLDADHELRALGWSNLAASLVQGMPVGAGFSAGSASEAAGAQTRMVGLIAAAGMLVLIAAGNPIIAHLPQPVLAAVVIAALTHALNPAPIVRLKLLRADFIAAIGAIAGVLLFGVLNGMLLAIVGSLILLIHRLSSPQLMRLGRLGSHDFVDIARHPEALLPTDVMVWRPSEPLFFGNAERMFAQVNARQMQQPAIKAVVVSLEESFSLDSSALDALTECDTQLATRGVRLYLARVSDTIRDLLLASGKHDLAKRCAYSVDDAVAAAQDMENTT